MGHPELEPWDFDELKPEGGVPRMTPDVAASKEAWLKQLLFVRVFVITTEIKWAGAQWIS